MILDHEQVLIRRGPRSGAHAIVAVHSTALGPALGGCRMWRYGSVEEGVADALALAAAMTLKAAAAGLALGGGKGVICVPPGAEPTGALRSALLHDFADVVDALHGAYITAEDVGTGAQDMVEIAQHTPHVAGLPAGLPGSAGSGDPSPFTAAGVEAAIRACLSSVYGSAQLRGRSVAVVGCGNVGGRLARSLARAGARLLLADVDPRRRPLAAALPEAVWTEPETALEAEVDVVAPCALGGVIDAARLERLRCRIVCGAANNQLADDGLAAQLARRGILYAPDFIVNSGGLINVALELDGYDATVATARVARIEGLMGSLLQEAAADGVTPLEAARRRARARLATAQMRGSDCSRRSTSANRSPRSAARSRTAGASKRSMSGSPAS